MSIKHIVGRLLLEEPETRDNDLFLIVRFMEHIDPQICQGTSKQLLDKIKHGRYGSYESIRRCRQYLQEHYEDLRGETYEKRQAHAKDYTKQLRFNFG